VGTRREKTGIGWKEKKAECATRERQLSRCGMDVRNERDGEKETGRNTEVRRKGDRMDKRDMEDEGKDREGERWAIGIKKVIFEILELIF
jgi:hypothetical protein